MNFPTRQEFEAWLRSLPPEQEVAPSRYKCTSCPLANYLKDQGYQHAYVSPAPEDLSVPVWRIVDPLLIKRTDLQQLPGWANTFAMRADRWASDIGGIGFAPITAARALALLEGIDES